MWDLDFKDSTAIVGSISESGTDLTFGFGANFDFSRSTALRVEYQVYSNIGDANTTGESDVSVLGAGLVFKF
jgi:opacity protein-like surface antigen